MLVLTTHITIGKLEFRHAASVTCESGWAAMGDKATVTMPRNVEIRGGRLAGAFKAGDKAVVKVGYGKYLTTLISGKVVRVSPELPVVVEIEDEFYDLRRTTVSRSYRTVSLKALLADILPGTKLSVPDIDLGKLRIDQCTVARVLLDLQQSHGIYSFFRDGTLHSGFAYAVGPAAIHTFSFQENIVSSGLTYVDDGERKLKVKAVSFMPDGSSISVELGDSDGDQRTLHYYGLTEVALRTVANGEISRLKAGGYEGEMVVFGSPRVRHGDAVKLSDKFCPERAGTYFVDSVKTDWGTSGFRQTLKLGKKA